MKRVHEYRRKQAVAKAKEIPIYALPQLIFDTKNQEQQVYDFIGHDPLTNVDLDAFVADDHVHKINDLMTGLFVSELDDVA